MPSLTQSEMQYISTIQQKLIEVDADKNSPSEVREKLMDQTKAFWEYVEKKYGVDINRLDRIEMDGTMVEK